MKQTEHEQKPWTFASVILLSVTGYSLPGLSLDILLLKVESLLSVKTFCNKHPVMNHNIAALPLRRSENSHKYDKSNSKNWKYVGSTCVCVCMCVCVCVCVCVYVCVCFFNLIYSACSITKQ